MLPIVNGAARKPLRVVLQGQEGVGKTTWASKCPGSVFLTCEDGGGMLDYARVLLPTWHELREAVWQLQRDPQGIRTIVIDTIDGYERLLWADICEKANVDTIEEVGGGFGKGYTRAAEQMQQLIRDVGVLRDRHGMNVIVLAHVHVRSFNDPTGPAYDRYEMRLHKGTAALWSSWADAVLFACFDATVLKAGKQGRLKAAETMEKGKATEVRRVVYTTKEAAFDAKNRDGLPEELPLEWAAFAKAIRWDAHVVTGPDASWEADRVAFVEALEGMGLSYDAVEAWCVASRKPKPSHVDAAARGRILVYLRGDGRAKFDAWMGGGNAASAK